jgi:ATP-dependent Clp protease adaptor protein ClpS
MGTKGPEQDIDGTEGSQSCRSRDLPGPCPPVLEPGPPRREPLASWENGAVTPTSSTAPVEVDRPSGEDVALPDRVWLVIVWNDPINLMSYVTYVFQKLFGYSREKATKLMLDVHHRGKAAVSSGTREKAEFDTYRLHQHGLWATMQRD